MVTTDQPDELRWFSVRCLFKHGDAMYDERITVWRARDFAHSIELAEAEGARYAGSIADAHVPTTRIEFAQAYELVDEPSSTGAEVFSLLRDSDLPPAQYVDRYFDTGDEHQEDL